MTLANPEPHQAPIQDAVSISYLVAAMIPAIVVLLLSLSHPAAAEETSEPSVWAVKLGLGPGLAPTFEGSDNYEVIPVPQVEIKWRDRVFLGSQGLGVNVYRGEHARFGVRLGYNLGRDQDDDSALRGLGDVDPSVEAGVFGSLSFGSWTLAGQISQDVADGHDGALATAGLTYTTKLTDDLMVAAGPGLTWASENYMQSYFGVTAAQSARSGLQAFNPDSGIKDVGLNARVTYSLTENWSTSVIGRYTRLTGDAADSPIVQTPNQFFVGAVLGYSF